IYCGTSLGVDAERHIAVALTRRIGRGQYAVGTIVVSLAGTLAVSGVAVLAFVVLPKALGAASYSWLSSLGLTSDSSLSWTAVAAMPLYGFAWTAITAAATTSRTFGLSVFAIAAAWAASYALGGSWGGALPEHVGFLRPIFDALNPLQHLYALTGRDAGSGSSLAESLLHA